MDHRTDSRRSSAVVARSDRQTPWVDAHQRARIGATCARERDAPHWTFAARGRPVDQMPMGPATSEAYARSHAVRHLMAAKAFIVPLVKLSLALMVLAIGLRSSEGDALWLIRRPGLLARSILSINVIVPLVALAVTQAFDLQPAVEVAIVALSISPVPPILPIQAGKAGGESAYAIGLLTVVSLAAIVLVPLSVMALAALLGGTAPLAGRPVAILDGRGRARSARRRARDSPPGSWVRDAHGQAGERRRNVRARHRPDLDPDRSVAGDAEPGRWQNAPRDPDRHRARALRRARARRTRRRQSAGARARVGEQTSSGRDRRRQRSLSEQQVGGPAVLLQFIVAALASVPYIRRLKQMGARQRGVEATELQSPATDAARGSSGRLARPTRNGRSR